MGHMIKQCAITYLANVRKKTASKLIIYLRATTHICIEMNEEEEQNKTPLFAMENEGVARR